MDEQQGSRRAKQYAWLEATATNLDDESSDVEVLKISREARKQVAARRRQQLGLTAGDVGANPEELDRDALER